MTHVVQSPDTDPAFLDRLIHEQAAADFLSVSIRTLQAWRVRGGGPRYCKIGRAVRYRRADLTAWVEEKTRASTSELRRAS